jgi:hypothetical protein
MRELKLIAITSVEIGLLTIIALLLLVECS